MPEAFVQDNLIKNVGRGLWFSGANTNNKVTCNDLESPEIGWVIINPDLADQGDATTPQENKWRYPNGYTCWNEL
ncbi:MAG: hypothetical protein IPO92_20295 [Saprospiraceae bacterium]|nr:hypothetical protein [Saprospiraceae bacterium]